MEGDALMQFEGNKSRIEKDKYLVTSKYNDWNKTHSMFRNNTFYDGSSLEEAINFIEEKNLWDAQIYEKVDMKISEITVTSPKVTIIGKDNERA